jgi:hypothetical protein
LCLSRKINPRIPRNNLLDTTTSKTRVSNPLSQLLLLMVTKEKKLKIRKWTGIATFVGEMVMWSLNVLKRWNP